MDQNSGLIKTGNVLASSVVVYVHVWAEESKAAMGHGKTNTCCTSEFSTNAELSGLRQQYEVVYFGFTLTLLSVLLPTVAAFCRFLPPKFCCNSMERVVMGDMNRYRNGTSKLKHVQFAECFLVCVCVFRRERERPSSQTSARQMLHQE